MDSFELEGGQYFWIACPSPLLSHNKAILDYKKINQPHKKGQLIYLIVDLYIVSDQL